MPPAGSAVAVVNATVMGLPVAPDIRSAGSIVSATDVTCAPIVPDVTPAEVSPFTDKVIPVAKAAEGRPIVTPLKVTDTAPGPMGAPPTVRTAEVVPNDELLVIDVGVIVGMTALKLPSFVYGKLVVNICGMSYVNNEEALLVAHDPVSPPNVTITEFPVPPEPLGVLQCICESETQTDLSQAE